VRSSQCGGRIVVSEGVPDMACGRRTCPVEVADSPRAAAGWSEMGLQLNNH